MRQFSLTFCLIAALIAAKPSLAQRRSDKNAEDDSTQFKLNELLTLLSGTRLTLLDCRNVTRSFCYSTVQFLNQSGFKGTILGEDVNNPSYESLCEIVEVKPTIVKDSKHVTDLSITFTFCDKRALTFINNKKIAINYADYYLVEFEERLTKEFRRICPINKPNYLSSSLIKLQSKAPIWEIDSLKKYIKKRPKDTIEGIYEQVVLDVNKKEPNLTFGVVRRGNGYDIIYIEGYPNFRDWVAGEYIGHLEPTGSRELYKTTLIDNLKEEKRNLFATYEDGRLRLSTPSDLGYGNSPNGMPSRRTELFIKKIELEEANEVSSATAFAVSSAGVVVTNFHVVENASEIYIKGVNGNFNERKKASLLASDKNNDLAVLKIDGAPDLGPLPFQIAPKIAEVGTKVFVLGYPAREVMGSELKVTDGVISSRSGHEGDISCYQLSAPIQPGNSGSPVFDAEGKLIGVANAGLRFLFDNVSYAVKSTYLNNLLLEVDVKAAAISPSSLKDLPLTEQVKALRKYVYIIEVER